MMPPVTLPYSFDTAAYKDLMLGEKSKQLKEAVCNSPLHRLA